MSSTRKSNHQNVDPNPGGRWLPDSPCCFRGVVGCLSVIASKILKNGLYALQLAGNLLMVQLLAVYLITRRVPVNFITLDGRMLVRGPDGALYS